MEKRGVSESFLKELAASLHRIKQCPNLGRYTAVAELDSTLKKLQQASGRDYSAGVPSPVDSSPVSLSSSFASSDFNDSVDVLSLDLAGIKKKTRA